MRRLLALLALAFLAASAGCTAFGGGSVDETALAEGVDHDWNTTADATVVLEKDRYRAVFDVSGQETIELYRPRRLNNREPVDPVGLDFRYPNGTVINVTERYVNRSNGATVVTLPAPNGSIAFEASRQGKNLRLPTAVNGSYELVLPPGGRVKYPLLGRVVPRGYTTSTGDDGRVRIRWEQPPDRDLIAVEYYLARDLLILGGIVAVGGVAVLAGSVYFLFTIRKLRRRRDEVDINLEGGDSG